MLIQLANHFGNTPPAGVCPPEFELEGSVVLDTGFPGCCEAVAVEFVDADVGVLGLMVFPRTRLRSENDGEQTSI